MSEKLTSLAAIQQRIEQQLTITDKPLYIAIDGYSGSGKSTLTAALQSQFGTTSTTVIEGDSFYGGGSASEWDNRCVADNATHTIDREKLVNVILSLQQTGNSTWQAFDWHSKQWNTNHPSHYRQSARESSINIIEGVYTAQPALALYYDLKILLTTPRSLCEQRNKQRDGEDYCARWAQRWRSAESYYFEHVAPLTLFDIEVPSH